MSTSTPSGHIRYWWFKDEYPHDAYEVTLKEWGRLFGTEDRTVAKTRVGNIEISTVFLGLGDALTGRGGLWETMLFGEVESEYQWRYATYVEAAKHHVRIFMHLMTGGRPVDIDGEVL